MYADLERWQLSLMDAKSCSLYSILVIFWRSKEIRFRSKSRLTLELQISIVLRIGPEPWETRADAWRETRNAGQESSESSERLASGSDLSIAWMQSSWKTCFAMRLQWKALAADMNFLHAQQIRVISNKCISVIKE